MTTARPADVTAIVTTYNRANYLGDALDSVLGQTVPPTQVIVVNDGSTDRTADVLRGYGERIEVIDQENVGKPHALNGAMPRVRGAYTWIFDDDDIALAQNLERHLAVLEAHPQAGFVYSGCRIIESSPDGRITRKGRMPMPEVADDEIFPRMLEQNFMQQQAMLVRTRCYEEVGPFDANLDHSEDYEMNLRLARRFPGKGLNVESFLFRHHQGTRGQPGARFFATDRYRRWIDSNRALLLRLHPHLELGEYLPRSLGSGPLDEPRRRRALLQRASVMARCGLWEQALTDFSEALIHTMPGAPLGAAEQGLCRRALAMYLRRDPAVEGLIDDPTLVRRFESVLEETGSADVRRVFASELSRYAWTKLSHGRKPAYAAAALVLARRLAGVRSWIPDRVRP
ncbi:MAG: glycosyltransferase [Reyranella sp.]|nr:glycosyltransferase [Reyranella sp.]